jgi:5-methylcytosine-specific restriction enzyme A
MGSMSKRRRSKYIKDLPKGPNGKNMCRNNCGKEVKPPRRTFCSNDCVHKYRIKSDLSYMRKAVFNRDKGICSLCKQDCEDIRLELALLKHRDKNLFKAKLQELKLRPSDAYRKTFWDADHILPVCKGGGECGLENLRTLCIPCHRGVTGQLRKEL